MPFDNNVNFNVQQTSNLTSNLNYLAPASFRMSIDRLKFPNVEYSVQTVVLPDVTVNPAIFHTPQRNIGIPGDKVDFTPLQISFLVDEEMKNYQEIYDWMIGEVTQADNDKEYSKTRDLTLSVLSSHNNVVKQIQFIDAYPTSLSSLPFDLTITDVQYLTSLVSFEYSYFKLV